MSPDSMSGETIPVLESVWVSGEEFLQHFKEDERTGRFFHPVKEVKDLPSGAHPGEMISVNLRFLYRNAEFHLHAKVLERLEEGEKIGLMLELLPEERSATAADIIRFVAHHYGIRVADLKGRSNRRSIALPRQVSMYLIRNILELSFPEIGRIFSKHHSTAIYAVDTIQKARQSNPDFDATLTSFHENFS